MSFPVPNATASFWRSQPHELDIHRSTEELPAEVDIVIIGAGYSGASIVHHLLEQQKDSGRNVSIAIFEAREACSGATGRNGGHLKPDPYYRAAGALEKYGKEAAEEVASFEARQVKAIQKLVEDENIDCDFVVTRATDVCLYEAAKRDLKSGLDKLKKADISTASEAFYSDERSAEGVSGIKGAKACFTYTAGHIWPYKLVLHLLAKAVASGVNLQTNNPVTSVTAIENSTSPRNWSVNTSRGSVHTSKVIYATNAYTSTLLPQFKTHIIPVRGICARILPTKSHAPLLSNSYILRLSPSEYDYLIPRADGSIIVGGARRDYYKDLSQWYNNADDSQLIEPAKHYFDGYMQRHFRGWEDSGAYTEKVWTGIMGYSSDGFPFVGEVEGKSGQVICAGFSGHGMPQIYLAAKAVARIALEGTPVEETEVPRLYWNSRERMERRGNVTMEGWRASHGRDGGAKL